MQMEMKPLVWLTILSSYFMSVTAQQVTQCQSLTQCNMMCMEPEGTCMSNGKCRCVPGSTGPRPVLSGVYDNTTPYGNVELVDADHCLWTCDPRQAGHCTAPCNRRCNYPYGKCLPDGLCRCWWGWTGPNAFYITAGEYSPFLASVGQLKADYCVKPCHFTHDNSNPWCGQLSL